MKKKEEETMKSNAKIKESNHLIKKNTAATTFKDFTHCCRHTPNAYGSDMTHRNDERI